MSLPILTKATTIRCSFLPGNNCLRSILCTRLWLLLRRGEDSLMFAFQGRESNTTVHTCQMRKQDFRQLLNKETRLDHDYESNSVICSDSEDLGIRIRSLKQNRWSNSCATSLNIQYTTSKSIKPTVVAIATDHLAQLGHGFNAI